MSENELNKDKVKYIQNRKLKTEIMKTIVVNGANGYVASNFINSLLKHKYKVIALVRGAKNFSAKQRMEEVLSEMDENRTLNTDNLEVYSYSLLEKNFALDEDKLQQIFHTDVDYFHFAASLKYDEKSVDEIFTVNIEGVKNSVSVFKKYATKRSRFFYIGTAYSCGNISGVFEEKFYKNEEISAFRNYYELSKRFAENIIKHNNEKYSFNGHVIRLSQVVGNHKTGVTKTDYGIFDFSKRVCNLANRYPNEVIRAHIDPRATQNLISINTVVDYLLQTVAASSVPVIMNFVAKKSIRNEYIINVLNELLPVTMVPLKRLDSKTMNPIERMIAIGMSFTESYTATNLVFDTRMRDEIIHSTDEHEIGEENVLEMLKYFIRSLSDKKKVAAA